MPISDRSHVSCAISLNNIEIVITWHASHVSNKLRNKILRSVRDK